MEQFTFRNLEFAIDEGRIRLQRGFDCCAVDEARLAKTLSFAEIQIAGGNKGVRAGAKQISLSEGNDFRYVSHRLSADRLEIVQRTESVQTVTSFEAFPGTSALRIRNTVENVGARTVTLESVNAFSCFGLGGRGAGAVDEIFLHRFHNSCYTECQPQIHSLRSLGLCGDGITNMKAVRGFNTGSWSTKEELPQAILEDRAAGRFLMFQIENNGSWYWEVLEYDNFLVLNVAGPNEPFSHWSKKLRPGERFVGVAATFCGGGSLNEVLAEMTAYRRIGRRNPAEDRSLPIVYNEYMHGYWENSTEENTARLAPFIASLGVDYYVIDCGWHDEEEATFPYVGRWKESKRRFPSGIKRTVDCIHACGMKAGLWLEVEAVGLLCREMNEYYTKDCFFLKNGEKISAMGRYQLDFRNPRVREYIAGVLRTLVEEVGVDYIKIDYNQCTGPGTEQNSDSLGDGLLEHNRAYLRFLEEMVARYPHLLIESCASGGQRLDAETLRNCQLVSVSDQTDYRRFPYIAANIGAAVLPEQAAVWSYPAALGLEVGQIRELTAAQLDECIGEEQIVMNMVNAMLGRLYLASFLQLLSPAKLELVQEGIAFYRAMAADKRVSVPYLPLGYATFGAPLAVSGLRGPKRVYLAVWNLRGSGEVTIPLADLPVSEVRLGYPRGAAADFVFQEGALRVRSLPEESARVFVAELR